MTTPPVKATVDDLPYIERENSNLRKLLMWAARRLPPEDVRELSDMMKGKFVSEGGVTQSEFADDRIEAMRIRRYANQTANFLDEILEREDQDDLMRYLDKMGSRISDSAQNLRNALGPEPEPTLDNLICEELPIYDVSFQEVEAAKKD